LASPAVSIIQFVSRYYHEGLETAEPVMEEQPTQRELQLDAAVIQGLYLLHTLK
jgi:hypothetical protein